MTEFVRVRLANGYEATLSKAYVDGLTNDSLEVLDVPATSSRGVPLPATRRNGRPVKPRTTVNEEAAKHAAAQQQSDPGPSDDPSTGGVAAVPEEAAK